LQTRCRTAHPREWTRPTAAVADTRHGLPADVLCFGASGVEFGDSAADHHLENP